MSKWMAAVALVALGCAAPGNRVVVEDATSVALREVLRGRAEARGAVSALAISIVRAPVAPPVPTGIQEATAPRAPLAVDAPRVDVLFEDLAPGIDVGLPVTLDFGVGEAPYDDGTRPIHPGTVRGGGFSDSILSLLWQRPLPRGLALTGRAALVRPQDLAVLDGLSEARFAFAVLGITISF